jgi:hypothetical protein
MSKLDPGLSPDPNFLIAARRKHGDDVNAQSTRGRPLRVKLKTW